jgi:hypothetical protein
LTRHGEGNNAPQGRQFGSVPPKDLPPGATFEPHWPGVSGGSGDSNA